VQGVRVVVTATADCDTLPLAMTIGQSPSPF
jgi:hypothetical protein